MISGVKGIECIYQAIDLSPLKDKAKEALRHTVELNRPRLEGFFSLDDYLDSNKEPELVVATKILRVIENTMWRYDVSENDGSKTITLIYEHIGGGNGI